MNKKLYIVLAVTLLVFLTGCQDSNHKILSVAIATSSNGVVIPLSNFIDKQYPVRKEPIQNPRTEFSDDAFIIESSEDDTDNKTATILKDGTLQFWSNQTMLCEKQIPPPARLSIGNNIYDTIGNPYISKDGSLVLIQSYTTSDGNPKLDYTVLAEQCSKIIRSSNYGTYVFKDYEGQYGLVFCNDDSPYLGYSYEGLYFYNVDDNFVLPKPTVVELNETTVKSVNFTYWGSANTIWALAVCLDVEAFGPLNITYILNFDEIDIDDNFDDIVYEKFPPEEYYKKLFKLLRILNSYKQNGNR